MFAQTDAFSSDSGYAAWPSSGKDSGAGFETSWPQNAGNGSASVKADAFGSAFSSSFSAGSDNASFSPGGEGSYVWPGAAQSKPAPTSEPHYATVSKPGSSDPFADIPSGANSASPAPFASSSSDVFAVDWGKGGGQQKAAAPAAAPAAAAASGSSATEQVGNDVPDGLRKFLPGSKKSYDVFDVVQVGGKDMSSSASPASPASATTGRPAVSFSAKPKKLWSICRAKVDRKKKHTNGFRK